MKTQVVHLETFDDRHSILDRLNWGQADQIIMIWPLRGLPLDHKLDLKLIHRRCQTSNIQLALVCKTPPVVDEARALGIPVFRSLRQAQRVAWEYSQTPYIPPEKPEHRYSRSELAALRTQAAPPAWLNHKNSRLIAFSASILAVLALVIFLLPGATIRYLPEFESQQLQLTLLADPEISAYNLSGAIPARKLAVSVEGRAETTPSGETRIPDQAATGIIQFTNLTNQEITIPAGTIIRTSDPNTTIRFSTATETIIPGTSGAATLVPIEALNPGPNSNLPANALVIIEGTLSRQLTANNPEPTSGGTEKRSLSPSPEDYADLRDELLISLWQTALDEANQLLDDGDVVLDTAPRKAVVIEETYSPANPEPSNTLSLILQVEYEILYLSWEDLSSLGNATLDAVLEEGYQSQPTSLEILSRSAPFFSEDEKAEWAVTFQRQIFKSDQLAPAVQQILGRTPERAAQQLETNLGLSQSPEIVLFPEWWPILPLTEVRITTIDLLQE